ncbi:MAG: hypothetical protein ACXIU5_14160 [Halomonadaceae bacterium]|jgi:hypothetical protein|uniref:hypothetical protein n=1 Tax=Halomonas sp. MCCC 1A11062 TaxID=2733485 RepID=UPI001F282BEC|nr:hypothetical protein [Halomonas sp. MCCC 1A11062]MCE8038678.1 hypothetical protein [Halomonas sp. MCCC 1A11062]
MTTIMSISRKSYRRLARFPRRFWHRFAPRQYPIQDLSQDSIGPLEALYAYPDVPCLIRCRLADCRWYGSTGIAYGPGSRHPYVQSLQQYVTGECRDYRGSCLEAYWQRWQPTTLAASLGLSEDVAHPWLSVAPPLRDFLPWSGLARWEALRAYADSEPVRREMPVSRKDATAIRQVGPKPTWFGERRIAQLVALYETIVREGYRRWASQRLDYFRQHIVVDTLERDGEVRFVVANGQHRASVLSVLGHEYVPVLAHVPHRRGPSLVRREDFRRWPLVERGIFLPSQALEVFDRIFEGRQPDELPRLPIADSTRRHAAMS